MSKFRFVQHTLDLGLEVLHGELWGIIIEGYCFHVHFGRAHVPAGKHQTHARLTCQVCVIRLVLRMRPAQHRLAGTDGLERGAKAHM